MAGLCTLQRAAAATPDHIPAGVLASLGPACAMRSCRLQPAPLVLNAVRDSRGLHRQRQLSGVMHLRSVEAATGEFDAAEPDAMADPSHEHLLVELRSAGPQGLANAPQGSGRHPLDLSLAFLTWLSDRCHQQVLQFSGFLIDMPSSHSTCPVQKLLSALDRHSTLQRPAV